MEHSLFRRQVLDASSQEWLGAVRLANTAVLQAPSGFTIAEGVPTIAGGIRAIVAGVTLTMGSAGLFSAPGIAEIAIGVAGIGVGAAELAPTLKK
jgi:hypothetical protein